MIIYNPIAYNNNLASNNVLFAAQLFSCDRIGIRYGQASLFPYPKGI